MSKGSTLSYDAWVNVNCTGNNAKITIGGYDVSVAASASYSIVTSWSGFVPKNTTISWTGTATARACQVE